MPTAIHRIVEQCRAKAYPAMLARLPSGWAVMGGSQFLTGYSLLLPDPVVPHLNSLSDSERRQFLIDMANLGDAVLASTGAVRINYAMFGNVEPALHAHVIPRSSSEAAAMQTAHPWAYDWNAAPQFSMAHHGSLQLAIRARLIGTGDVLAK